MASKADGRTSVTNEIPSSAFQKPSYIMLLLTILPVWG